MTQRILVVLDPDSDTPVATDTAIDIARLTGGEVTGLAFVDKDSIGNDAAGGGIGSMYFAERLREQLTEETREKAKALIAAFTARVEAQGVAHSGDRVGEGELVKSLLDEMRTHDLLVLAGLLVPLLVVMTASAWLDLARAACIRQSIGESLKRGWWALKGSSGTYTWVTVARVALGAPLLMLPLPPMALLIVLQSCALLSTFLRSRWLAEAWRHVAAKVSEIPSDS